jgi:hypothetical protein
MRTGALGSLPTGRTLAVGISDCGPVHLGTSND